MTEALALDARLVAPRGWYRDSVFVALESTRLYEAFKQDGLEPAVPITSYATRVRRQVIDIAGKIVEHSHRLTLKVTEATFDRLDFQVLWDRVSDPPHFGWA